MLLWWALAGPVWAAANEPRLSVVYRPPQLSVEARDVTLAQVLEAIGVRVGFTVVDTGGARPGLTVSLEDLPLDEVLRRLLSGENHVLIFGREGGAPAGVAIDTVVLMGPSSSAAAASGESRSMQGPPKEIIPRAAALTRAAGARPADQPAIGDDEGRRGDGGGAEDGTALQVEAMLRSHALSGLGPLAGGMPSAADPTAVNHPMQSLAQMLEPSSAGQLISIPVPSDSEQALAITTRLARENLSALIDGLATATRSLGGSLGPTGR